MFLIGFATLGIIVIFFFHWAGSMERDRERNRQAENTAKKLSMLREAQEEQTVNQYRIREYLNRIAEMNEREIECKRAEEEWTQFMEQAEGAKLVSDSKALAARLPVVAAQAELFLDTAEEELADGRYTPFWEAMEEVIQKIREFENLVISINNSHNEYAKWSANRKDGSDLFSIGIIVLPNMGVVTERMKGFYRKAQQDPDFAKIYELRRMVHEQQQTNSILIKEFRSLNEAFMLSNTRIEAQVEMLGRKVDFRLSNIETALKHTADQLAEQHINLMENARRLREEAENSSNTWVELANESARQAEQDAEERQANHAETLQMLDNIQRRRKPIIKELRDGEY